MYAIRTSIPYIYAIYTCDLMHMYAIIICTGVECMDSRLPRAISRDRSADDMNSVKVTQAAKMATDHYC